MSKWECKDTNGILAKTQTIYLFIYLLQNSKTLHTKNSKVNKSTISTAHKALTHDGHTQWRLTHWNISSNITCVYIESSWSANNSML